MNKFERGSEWRKWDLHIHSPCTLLNNFFNSDWDSWVAKIRESDIKVIGLTNYFKFRDDEITTAKEKLGSDILVLPNLEFRLAQTNKENTEINIHILFSEKNRYKQDK